MQRNSKLHLRTHTRNLEMTDTTTSDNEDQMAIVQNINTRSQAARRGS